VPRPSSVSQDTVQDRGSRCRSATRPAQLPAPAERQLQGGDKLSGTFPLLHLVVFPAGPLPPSTGPGHSWRRGAAIAGPALPAMPAPRIPESQNGRGWKGPLGVISSNPHHPLPPSAASSSLSTLPLSLAVLSHAPALSPLCSPSLAISSARAGKYVWRGGTGCAGHVVPRQHGW